MKVPRLAVLAGLLLVLSVGAAFAGVWVVEGYAARYLDRHFRAVLEDDPLVDQLEWDRVSVSAWRRGVALHGVRLRDALGMEAIKADRIGCERFWQRDGVVVSLACEARGARVSPAALALATGMGLPPIQLDGDLDASVSWDLTAAGELTQQAEVVQSGLGAVRLESVFSGATPALVAQMLGSSGESDRGPLAPDLAVRRLSLAWEDLGGLDATRGLFARLFDVPPAQAASVAAEQLPLASSLLGLPSLDGRPIASFLERGGTLVLISEPPEPVKVPQAMVTGTSEPMEPAALLGWVAMLEPQLTWSP